MGNRAKAGTLLAALVQIAIPLLQMAERLRPRTGPGDKPRIPDWVMAALIMIAVLKRKKSKSAQYRFLCAKRRKIGRWLGDGSFPSRATYFRRYRRAYRLYREAIRLQGKKALEEGVANAKDVAVDKSLIEAQGPPWHQQDRGRGRTPVGLDREGAWGYSEHDGWVYGYSYEAVVTATPDSTVFPLLVTVDVASAGETRSFAAKIDQLPCETETVSADSGYDANHLGEKLEYDDSGGRTGRHFLCPQCSRNTKPIRKTKIQACRMKSRERRRQRREFLESPEGRRIYARRRLSAEPFNQWFKSTFELEGSAWHRGLENNQTQMLAAIFVYQLLVRHNHRCGNKNGQVRWLMDAL